MKDTEGEARQKAQLISHISTRPATVVRTLSLVLVVVRNGPFDTDADNRIQPVSVSW